MADLTSALRDEQMRGHLAILRTAVIGSGVTGLVTMASQWSHVSSLVTLLWGGALAFTLALRGVAAVGYRRVPEGEKDGLAIEWLKRFRSLYLLHGMVWGSAAWLLLPAGEMSQQLVPILAIIFVGVGALGVGAFDPTASFLFTLLAFVPLTWRLLFEGGEAYAYISLLLMILLTYVRQIGRRAHGHVRENVALRVAEATRIEALLGSERQLVAEIQARRASEFQTERALKVAEAASHAKSDFLARMSHEVRTPLNGILGVAQLMDRTTTDPALRTQIGIVEASGTQLLNIINDVLDFSKIAEGKLQLRNEPLRLHPTIHEVGCWFQSAAERKGLHFGIEVDPDIPTVLYGDDARLRQVLTNLLDNAVKFTPAGEVRLMARVLRSGRDYAWLRFEVTDTGIGVPSSHHAQIFESFSQVESARVRRFGGTGLGLAICKGLISAMGGEIGVLGGDGPGSTFWFEVPLPRATSGQDSPSGRVTTGSVHPQAWFAAEVLLVEDNAVNALIARQMLELLGCRVQTASNGGAAVEEIGKRRYDLVLMDLHMPGMDGFVATRMVREREQASGAPRTPIVALTADALAADVDLCLAAGMDGHSAKPIQLAALERLLHKFVPAAGATSTSPS